MAMRRMGRLAAFSGTVLVGACVLVGSAFSRGNSAEEFCLPILMGALCLAMTCYEKKDGPMEPLALFACGLMAGMVATIKFTILGLFVGLCAAEGVFALHAGGMRRALRSAGTFLAGMALPIGPQARKTVHLSPFGRENLSFAAFGAKTFHSPPFGRETFKQPLL